MLKFHVVFSSPEGPVREEVIEGHRFFEEGSLLVIADSTNNKSIFAIRTSRLESITVITNKEN